MAVLPLTREGVYWVICILLLKILLLSLLVVDVNFVIMSNKWTIVTALWNTLVDYSLILATVRLVYRRLDVDQFVKDFNIVIFHVIGLNFFSGPQYCISHYDNYIILNELIKLNQLEMKSNETCHHNRIKWRLATLQPACI